jgi:hypothetical protein
MKLATATAAGEAISRCYERKTVFSTISTDNYKLPGFVCLLKLMNLSFIAFPMWGIFLNSRLNSL